MCVQETDLVRVIGRPEAGDHLYVVYDVHRARFTGVERINTHPLLPRLFCGLVTPTRQTALLASDLCRLPSPAEALEQAIALRNEAWPTRTRQSIERLFGLWLLHEDRMRLLDASTIDQLAHQVSLLEYIKRTNPRRMLIADEVGLGKTIEAGLIIDWVLTNNPSARVLYLAPAMLVENVHAEFRRMGLGERVRLDRYSAADATIQNADLQSARLIIASIHRAALDRNARYWHDRSGDWDLIIVDECHHLSDWSDDGTKPQQQMHLVRNLVERRLVPGGRLVLMSATPHQGNANRFRNLLRLLSDEGHSGAKKGDLNTVAGRVVYRTKEDVRDWDGQPLFSRRQVNEPTYVRVGEEYAAWLKRVELVFAGTSSRAAGWRKAQALQWSASSPKAGLAYLVRLALRSGLTFDGDPLVARAAMALLPYRSLPETASLQDVRSLLERQAGLHRAQPEFEEDAEEAEAEATAREEDDTEVDLAQLTLALEEGIRLLHSNAMTAKMEPLIRWIHDEAPAKFVVFASPIETVDEIQRGLEVQLGQGAVVTITGALQPHERRDRMQAFRRQGARVLVASKAGSEGVNLQIAHRLVHFDVPWNPMELEQRVGRVHRYGNTETVVVDTIVVSGSREERLLSRCRARLAQILRTLYGEPADVGRFAEMYSRVMAQVPAEVLAQLLADENFFTADGDERLFELIDAGFQGWQATHTALAAGRDSSLGEVPDRGHARDSDMEAIFEVLGASPEQGWFHVRLTEHDGKRIEQLTPARVWAFPAEGAHVRRVADRIASLTVRGPDGFSGFVERAGLNLPVLATTLRQLVGGALSEPSRASSASRFVDGAGVARVPQDEWEHWLGAAGLTESVWKKGGILLGWSLRVLRSGSSEEEWTSLRLRLLTPDQALGQWLSGASTADLLRMLWKQRPFQNLVQPPHKRADNASFALAGLAEAAVAAAPDVLQDYSRFNAQLHEYEVVPVVALTIEARSLEAKGSMTSRSETVHENPDFLQLDLGFPPPADFLERVFTVLDSLPIGRSNGSITVYVLLTVEQARLDSIDPLEQRQAFGVYVGTTEQDVLTRYQQHRDPTHLLRAKSLGWHGVEPVGVLRLADRFSGLAPNDALELEGNVARALREAGLCVLGGH